MLKTKCLQVNVRPTIQGFDQMDLLGALVIAVLTKPIYIAFIPEGWQSMIPLAIVFAVALSVLKIARNMFPPGYLMYFLTWIKTPKVLMVDRDPFAKSLILQATPEDEA